MHRVLLVAVGAADAVSDDAIDRDFLLHVVLASEHFESD